MECAVCEVNHVHEHGGVGCVDVVRVEVGMGHEGDEEVNGCGGAGDEFGVGWVGQGAWDAVGGARGGESRAVFAVGGVRGLLAV